MDLIYLKSLGTFCRPPPSQVFPHHRGKSQTCSWSHFSWLDHGIMAFLTVSLEVHVKRTESSRDTHSVIVRRYQQVSVCSNVVFSSSIRLCFISVCSMKALMSCSYKVLIAWPWCASQPWCLSAAGEDTSDLTLPYINFCQVPTKLLLDQTTQSVCYKTLVCRTLLHSAVSWS